MDEYINICKLGWFIKKFKNLLWFIFRGLNKIWFKELKGINLI